MALQLAQAIHLHTMAINLACSGIHKNRSSSHWLTLQLCDNGHNGVWNHRRLECLLNRLFRYRSISLTRASKSENGSIWWRHHGNQVWCVRDVGLLPIILRCHNSPLQSSHMTGRMFQANGISTVSSTAFSGLYQRKNRVNQCYSRLVV